jgi:Tol biopolymer transport system component
MVPGSEEGSMPFWSPDGRYLAFFSREKLRKVSLDGSAPVALCDAPDARGGAWSPDGVIVFAPNNQGGIVRVSANGGTPVPVTQVNSDAGERGHRYPQFLPDGTHFLYVAIGAGDDVTTFATSIDGGTPVEVCKAGSMGRWAPPGHLVYLDTGVNSPQRRLLARRFDAGSLRASGDAELVIDDVSATNFGYANVVADARGMLIAQHWTAPRSRLFWRDRRGAVVGTAVDDILLAGGALSPDGKRLAYAGVIPRDLHVLDLETGVATRLTFSNQNVNNIRWSPDGQRLVFSRLFASRGWQIHVKAADGSGPDSLLFEGPGILNYAADWSKDGRWIIAQCADESGNFDLWKIPMTGGGTPELFQRTPAQESGGSFSPDGKWILYRADENGQGGIFVQSFPRPGVKYQVTIKDPGGAAWSTRGDELLVGNTGNEIFAVAISTSNGFRQGATTRLFRLVSPESFMDVENGERRFLIAAPKDASSTSRLEIVTGWQQLLEKAK